MRTSSFEHIVRLQFNAFMMIVIKGALSSQRRQIARRSKQEVLFCELSEMKQIEHSMNDKYSHEFVSFQVMNDREISELYHVSRSAINSRRDRGLKKLHMQVDEELKGEIHAEMMKAILKFEIRVK